MTSLCGDRRRRHRRRHPRAHPQRRRPRRPHRWGPGRAHGRGHSRRLRELVDFANEHSALRAWAIEGTGGHGAGLARLLAGPQRDGRRTRPARAGASGATGRSPTRSMPSGPPVRRCRGPKLGTPRSAGERQALSVLLAARRSAVEPSTDAQRQVFSLVIAAPEALRARFRGQEDPGHAPHRRPAAGHPRVGRRDGDAPPPSLRDLARRALELSAEAGRTKRPSWPSSAAGDPTCSTSRASAPSSPPPSCAPGPTPAGSAPRLRSPCSPASPPFPPTAARSPPGTVSTATATASSTAPSTPSSCPDPATTSHPGLRQTSHRRGQDRREIKRCLKRYVARDLYRLLESSTEAA